MYEALWSLSYGSIWATTSTPPPGENGTTILMVLVA
jgi:hypothetical protein